MQRLIGKFVGSEEGTLIIALAAMHGNETAGVQALKCLFSMLEEERNKNPDFKFKGQVVGLMGNIEAYKQNLRFVKKDLNRQLAKENIVSLLPKSENNTHFEGSIAEKLAYEDLELKELIEHIDKAIADYQPKKIIILDLHTTSATGGIFTIVSEDADSLKIATELYAPVVKGLIKGVGGSTLHYFKTANMGIPTTAIAFEAGQHDDPRSVQRTIAWLLHSFRAIGSIKIDDLTYKYDDLLRGYSKGLPKVVKLIGVHKIGQEDRFKMQPDYQNFQRVQKGEILAYDKNGAIEAPEDCLILMPLYQPQGNDGFFLVKEKEF